MSYNILSGNVNFADSQQGTLEDIVDTHTVQTIVGQKTFDGVLSASNIGVSNNIFHDGDIDTKVTFATNSMYIYVGGSNVMSWGGNVSPKVTTIASSDFKVNTSGLDFYISSSNGRVGIGMFGEYAHALEVGGDISASVNISASAYYGKATGITDVSSSAITGIIHPQNIYYGSSLTASSSTGSLGVKLTASSGLELTGYGLRWNPAALTIAGSVAGGDKIGIYDAVAGLPKQISVSTLSSTVLGDAAVTSYNGTNTNRVLTSGGEDTIDVEANLTFDGSILAVTGAISGSTTLDIGSHMSGAGDIRILGNANVANLNASADITGSSILLAGDIVHDGDTNTSIGFGGNDFIRFSAAGAQMLGLYGNLAVKKVQVDASDFKVNTSGLDFFITSSTGRVGIGVSDPDHALEILSGSASQLKLSYDAANSVTFGASSGGDLAITPSGGDISLAGNVSIDGNTTLGNASGDSVTINALAVSLPNGLNFDSNTLFISASNNRVGIGTVSPAHTLSVVGNISASAELIINTVSASAQIHAPNIASGSIAGSGSYLGLSSTGHIVLTSSLGGGTTDIDALSALGGTGLHDSQDHFMFSDNGTEKKITWANLYGATFSKVSGDATVASGGALTLANNSVEADQIATSVAGDGLTGGGGTALAVQVSGAVKIQSDKVALTGSLAGDGLGYLGGVDSISSLKVNVDDSSIEINSDSLRVKANGITDSMMNDDVASGLAGDGLTASSGVMAVQTSGSLRITSDKVAISGSLAGNGLDYSGGVDSIASLSVDVSDFMTNGSDNRVVTATGTDGMNAEANLTFDGTDLGVSDKIFHVGDTDTFINFTDDDINFQAGGVNFLDLTEDTQNEVTFNEGGVDIDFRVETADESHMLFIEGSSNRMSIGDNTGSPGATLEIKNHASAGATGVPLLQLNNNDTDQQCLDINAGNIDANVVNITANDVTTARVLAIGADGLTTGNAFYVDDNSSNTGTRNTALIIQNHTGAINAQALAVQSDGGKTGIKLDKNYSDLTEASIVGLNIDWDKTGASTSDNTMYGIQIDMDNTTATNGSNYMYGLHVTPTLTHAANAGSSFVYGALINAQGGTNGSSLVQGARIEAGGGDINYGLQLDVEDGGVDLRIESSVDSGDYFQIQTTTHGATTITTVDDNATAADLTFTIDGDITLDPAGGNVVVDGQVAIGTTGTANKSLAVSGSMRVSGSDVQMSFGSEPQLQLSASKTITGNTSLLEIKTPTKANLFSVNEAGMVGVDMVPAAFNASLYVSGASVVGAPTAALNHANLHTGSYSFYLDEGSNKLMVSVKYSNGTVKSGSILLD